MVQVLVSLFGEAGKHLVNSRLENCLFMAVKHNKKEYAEYLLKEKIKVLPNIDN